jgi:hypothetical protein
MGTDGTARVAQLQIVDLEHEVNVLKQTNEQLAAQMAEAVDSKDAQIAQLTNDFAQLTQAHAAQVRRGVRAHARTSARVGSSTAMRWAGCEPAGGADGRRAVVE